MPADARPAETGGVRGRDHGLLTYAAHVDGHRAANGRPREQPGLVAR